MAPFGWERPIPLERHESGMSRDRTRTRDRSESPSTDGSAATDVDLDVDLGIDDTGASTGEASRSETTRGESPRGATSRGGGLRDRLATRANDLFAPRRFLLALVLSVVGLVAAGTFVPLPASGLLGVFIATFLFGLALEERRYAEAAVAGGLTVGASFALDFAVVALLGGFGLPLAAIGAGVGGVIGLLGTYFGRDLRRGLTQEVP
jgi:hypothetical protein